MFLALECREILHPPKINRVKIINSFTKVTIALPSKCVEYFKEAAKKHHMQYQKIIRELLDEYASHQKNTNK